MTSVKKYPMTDYHLVNIIKCVRKLCFRNSIFPGVKSVNSLWPSEAMATQDWFNMATQNWVNIGSGNGLEPDGTKPIPEPMLTYHQWDLLAFTWGKFHQKCSRYLSLIWVWKLLIHYYDHISQWPMSQLDISLNSYTIITSKVIPDTGINQILYSKWH